MTSPYQAPDGAARQQGLSIDAKFVPINFFYYFVRPKVVINGHGVPASWNRNTIPLPPGRYLVQTHVPYFFPAQVGPAAVEVGVYPGQVVELEYRAPAWSFSAGALGAAPQKYNGLGLTLAVTLIPLALLLILQLLSAAGM